MADKVEAKEAYVAPQMEELGSFESMTKANASGSNLDATFPDGTPASDLTFS